MVYATADTAKSGTGGAEQHAPPLAAAAQEARAKLEEGRRNARYTLRMEPRLRHRLTVVGIYRLAIKRNIDVGQNALTNILDAQVSRQAVARAEASLSAIFLLRSRRAFDKRRDARANFEQAVAEDPASVCASPLPFGTSRPSSQPPIACCYCIVPRLCRLIRGAAGRVWHAARTHVTPWPAWGVNLR